jgi:hypothetical protein
MDESEKYPSATARLDKIEIPEFGNWKFFHRRTNLKALLISDLRSRNKTAYSEC